jgi:hypothetical protein
VEKRLLGDYTVEDEDEEDLGGEEDLGLDL